MTEFLLFIYLGLGTGGLLTFERLSTESECESVGKFMAEELTARLRREVRHQYIEAAPLSSDRRS